ncbi:hypothetical protein T11_3090, partial [Trichinella zimbabwensis]
LQTVKKNAYSLSASTAEFITCDEKSDNSMESSLRNSISSDANIPSRSQSAMFDQKTECYLESATSSCEYDQLACAIPQVQSLQLMDAKSQEILDRQDVPISPFCPLKWFYEVDAASTHRIR